MQQLPTTSFTNHYEWRDLKANPSKLLEKYFDAFVCVANWGTPEFYICLPQESIDERLFEAMAPGDSGCVIRRDEEDDGTCSQI